MGQDRRQEGIWDVSLWVPRQQPGEKVAWTDGGGGIGEGRRFTNGKKELDSAYFRKSQWDSLRALGKRAQGGHYRGSAQGTPTTAPRPEFESRF